MTRIPLKSRLHNFLVKIYPQEIASGELQRIVMQKTTYTPRTTVRRLEELQNEGKIKVSYKKGHSWYQGIISETLF